ncbi:PaaI family thioesterase [Aquihabitans sp. G128]|uniref:PaaI family thioesterase n=1 Tax=Aquihabitans sp. G128 TaxID=2849779 RepID=UPI001C24F680|nr:PaaI family thioesterase [Aquihabitans sp. G128]QXC59233.1 PaaI family thioesterase [Aquihabitans sp. G128]
MDLATLSGLELMQAFQQSNASAGIGAFLGMRLEEVSDGRAVFVLPTRPEFSNPLGTLHGGLPATLLDSAMGCAVHATLPAGTGYTTVDLNVTFLRPGALDGSELRAEGVVVHRGRRLSTATGTLWNADGKVLATATTSCLVLPPT